MFHLLTAALIQCSPVQWKSTPFYDGNNLHAEAITQCTFPSQNHGSIQDLFNDQTARIEQNTDPDAKVHKGPTPWENDRFIGSKYEMTVTEHRGNDTLKIHGDVVVARNSTEFWQTMQNTDVDATGPADRISVLDGEVMVTPNGDGYRADIWTKIVVERPKVMDKSKFIDFVGRQMTNEMGQNAQALITDFQKVL